MRIFRKFLGLWLASQRVSVWLFGILECMMSDPNHFTITEGESCQEAEPKLGQQLYHGTHSEFCLFFCPFSDPLLFTLIELFYLETVWLAKTTTWRSPISVWRGWSRRTSMKPGSGPGSRSSGPRLKQPTTAGNKSRQSWLKLDMIEVKYGIGVFWGCKLFRVGIQL